MPDTSNNKSELAQMIYNAAVDKSKDIKGALANVYDQVKTKYVEIPFLCEGRVDTILYNMDTGLFESIRYPLWVDSIKEVVTQWIKIEEDDPNFNKPVELREVPVENVVAELRLTNVEKLQRIGRLEAVRQRLGADDGTDECCDEQINKMSNSECIAKAMAWHLGDESWWLDFKAEFDQLEEFDRDPSL